jgi:CheY-like chemotaxis protein
MIQEMVARQAQQIGEVLDAMYAANLGEQADTIQAQPFRESDEAGRSCKSDGDPRPVILIVDDQPGIRTVLSVALGDDYRVVEASDGIEALAKATEHLPDVVITDVVMPKMDGVQLVQAIREHPDTAATPVIAMSGYHNPEARARLHQLGIAAFLQKPFSIVAIPELVARVLATTTRVTVP